MKKILAALATLFAFNTYGAIAEETKPLGGFQVGLFEWVNPETEQNEKFFLYVGDIRHDSSDAIQLAFNMYPDVKKVALWSDGGLATEADELGQLFSDNNIQTWVPSGRYCLSACANAFIGGHDYIVSGILGFHAAWIPLDQETLVNEWTPEKVNSAFGYAQYQGVGDAYYWMVNGFSIQMAYAVNGLTSPERFLIFKSAEELLTYYVRDDENPENNTLVNYMTYDTSRVQVVQGPQEFGPYLQAQWEELQNGAGRPVEFIDQIWPIQTEESN